MPKKKGDSRNPKEIPEAERWYFLEEKYPRFKNLVPRDVASREIYHAAVDLGMGVGGNLMVYLDLTHIDKATLPTHVPIQRPSVSRAVLNAFHSA